MPLIKHVPTANSIVKIEDREILTNPAAVAIPASVVVDTAPKEKYTGRKASSDTMSKEEWAAKDRRISRAGLYQAALQSQGLMQYAPTLDEYLAIVRRVADEGLKYVNEAAH